MSAPKPPSGLGKAGGELWRKIVGDVDPGWQLDERDLSYLAGACRAADRVAELDKLIQTDGLMVTGSQDQQRLHPAISEQRLQQALVAGLIGKIEMNPPKVSTRHLNGRQRAELRRLGGSDGAA